MTLGQKIATGTAWLFFARATGQVLGLASTIVVARFVTPEDYGVFAAAMGLLVMVSVFAEFPVGQAIIQLQDATEDDYDTAFTIGILRGSILALFLLLFAPLLASVIRDPRVSPVVMALAGYVFILGLRNPRLEWFARNMDFSRESYLEIGSKFIQFAAAGIFAVLMQSYWALVIAVTANATAQVIISYGLRPRVPRFTLKAFRRLFSYSVWMAGSSIMGQVYQLIDTITLGRISGTASLGAYSMGGLLASRIAELLSVPASRPLFAAIAQIQTETERLSEAVLDSMRFMAFLIVPIAITLTLLAEPIILLLLGPQWNSAVLVSQALAVISLSLIAYIPLQAVLMGTGRTHILFLRVFIFVIFYMPLTIYAVIQHGLTGLLAIKVTMVLLTALIDMLVLSQITRASILNQAGALMRPAIGGGAMTVLYMSLSPFIPTSGPTLGVIVPLVCVGTIGGAVYLLFLLGSWRLAGSPPGAEAKIIRLMQKGMQLLKLRLARQS